MNFTSLTKLKLNSDFSSQYVYSKLIQNRNDDSNYFAITHPQDYIQEIKESDRFSQGSYPKLKQLLVAKNRLLEKYNFPALIHSVPSFSQLDFSSLISE